VKGVQKVRGPGNDGNDDSDVNDTGGGVYENDESVVAVGGGGGRPVAVVYFGLKRVDTFTMARLVVFQAMVRGFLAR
jgi:hypothetical protein